MKTCKECKKEKLSSDFSPHKASPDGLAYLCKPCNSARGLVRYYEKRNEILAHMHKDREKNYERKIEIERNSRAKNKEKWRFARNARQSIRNRIVLGGKYVVLPKDLRRIYSSPCVECGSTENQSLDHTIPISRGGSHGVGNFSTLCLPCNISKQGRFFSEWRYSKSHILQK